MTTYADGFRALPQTTLSCTVASNDLGTFNSQGCGFCVPSLLANVNYKCILKSNDGLMTTICSQQNNGNMFNVTSCFSGTFSLVNNSPLIPKQQACNAPFCQVYYLTNKFIENEISLFKFIDFKLLSSITRMHWCPLVHVPRIARHRVQHFAALITTAIMFSFAIRVVL